MNGTLNQLKKLKGRSLDEFRVRGAQAVAAYAERNGLSAQARVPTDAAFFKLLAASREGGAEPLSAAGLLADFRARRSGGNAPAFFASFDAPDETLAELRRRFGARAETEVVERAARIVEGRFDLLGLRGLHFGDPVDWHLEPLSGKRSPLVHWSRINFLDPAVAGDKKVTWELNRHQYFATLGRAYWHTREEVYALTWVAHLDAWMEANPPKLGINWASSLEVAFRAISWLWALYFFRDSPSLTPAVYLRALKFLYLHARHLETYLSTYFSPNTHLTGEALGLFYLGALLPRFACASRWREHGRRIMIAELQRHVRPDGVYFEQSSYYHRYTADFYTHLYALTRARGEAVEPLLEAKLTALLDHLMCITRPDGTTGYYGDDDGGKLLLPDACAANDFRPTLSTAAALLARPDYKFLAGDEAAEETLWLLGAGGCAAFDRLAAHPPAHTSRAFPDGGYYVMRDGWSAEANFMLIDCGPHGSLSCGHAHADALSFELAARGRTLLVDPGTYTYTGAAEARDYFRSTPAHNTLTLDGLSSSVPGDGAFRWEQIARARTLRWDTHARFDFFEGEHDGYERLPAPALHRRGVLFVKGSYWIIRDRLTTKGAHRSELNFHFAAGSEPGIERRGEAVGVCERAAAAPGLEMFTFGHDGRWSVGQGWVSDCYGARTAAPVCTYAAEGEGVQELFTFLFPRAASSGATGAREIEATNGRAFEILSQDGRDLLLVGGGDEVTAASPRIAEATAASSRIASDFQWTWMRFAPDAEEPSQITLIGGGQSLSLDGREVFKAAERAGYVSAHRAGDELIIETDAGGDLFVAPLGARRTSVNGQPFISVSPQSAAREPGKEDLCVGLTE